VDVSVTVSKSHDLG